MNPELWDDLQGKSKSRECSFQSFQKNLIKGITPVEQLASEVVDAKKSEEESISLNDVYDLTVDALTLLGNSVYEFSVKRREMLKSVTSHSQLLRCCLAMSCRRVLATSRKLAAKSIGHDRRRASSSSSSYINFKNSRTNTSGSRRFGNHSRSKLNFKRHYEYRKPPYQRSQSPTRQPPKSSSTTTKLQ